MLKTRSLFLVAMLSVLSACQDSVEEKAEAAGCPNLEREVGMLFVRAGVSDRIQAEWERDMQRYGMRRSPFAYSNSGLSRASGEASSAAARSVFSLIGNVRLGPEFDPSEWTTVDDIGSALVNGLSSLTDDYPGRDRINGYFQRCSPFVGEYLISAERFTWAVDLYRNPDQ